MAPLTALLVVQVSIYQTLRTAVRRVASVVAGVLLALGLSVWVGFTWWSLGIAIALGLTVGYALHLHEEVLGASRAECSSVSGDSHRSAATGPIIENTSSEQPPRAGGRVRPGLAAVAGPRRP